MNSSGVITTTFLELAHHLELAGLIWHPEIGDEISERQRRESVSVLVDTQGLTPRELRSHFLWLPTLEQMVVQLEARQAILEHAGLEISQTSMAYKTVIKAPFGEFESRAQTLRLSVGLVLRDLLTCHTKTDGQVH
jgi:hypothetical protein